MFQKRAHKVFRVLGFLFLFVFFLQGVMHLAVCAAFSTIPSMSATASTICDDFMNMSQTKHIAAQDARCQSERPKVERDFEETSERFRFRLRNSWLGPHLRARHRGRQMKLLLNLCLHLPHGLSGATKDLGSKLEGSLHLFQLVVSFTLPTHGMSKVRSCA